jgi:cyclopropane-fatty-acyl-phospholipid synthase
MTPASLWQRYFVHSAWQQVGRPPITLVLWDGTELGADARTSIGRVRIADPQLLYSLWWDPELAFGVGYTDGRITLEGDLTDIMTALMKAQAALERQHAWRPTFCERLFPRLGNSRSNSSANVTHHYDLGNDFYRLWLDQQLVYTCAYYGQPGASLEQAQVAKLDRVCQKLRLRPGETVVEAGCGWGALALHMARQYGVRVRAYNLSKEQLAYARARAKAEGLDRRVEFVEADYREMTGPCDAFVSVGMLEHVGVAQFRELGRVVERLLSDTGRGLIHTIGRNVARPLDHWNTSYIFPGAEPPSLRQMMDLFEPAALSVLDVENLRLHYVLTLRDWLERFESHIPEVTALYDAKFVRMWRCYLAASIAAFESGYLQLFQVQFARANDNSIPLVRAPLDRMRDDEPEPFASREFVESEADAEPWQDQRRLQVL